MKNKSDRIAECSECGESKRIVYGWSTRAERLCYMCNEKRKNEKILKRLSEMGESRHGNVRVYIPQKSDALKNLQQKDRGVNNRIWNIRRHSCVECNKDLGKNPEKYMFSHLMSKGSHPELRHDPNNIVLHCFDCHQKWEFGKNRSEMKTWKLHIDWMVKNGYVIKEL